MTSRRELRTLPHMWSAPRQPARPSSVHRAAARAPAGAGAPSRGRPRGPGALALLLLALGAAPLAGCGDEPIGVRNSGPLPIVGEYLDAFGVAHIIDERRWVWGEASAPVVFDLVRWQAKTGYAIGRTRTEPPLYSRFDWRFDEDDLLAYCHTIEGAATAAAAEAIARDNCAPADWIYLFPLE